MSQQTVPDAPSDIPGQPGGHRHSVPVGIYRYLLPHEDPLAHTRQHPAVLLVPGLQALGGLIVAALLTATIVSGLFAAIIWLAWLVLAGRLIWKVLNWAVDYFVVTSKRLMLVTGFFTRKAAMMPLARVTDMSFQRTFAGRVLGYGEFIVESAGQDQALRNIEFIPYPEQLYLLVCAKLFPPSDEDRRDDESAEDSSNDGT